MPSRKANASVFRPGFARVEARIADFVQDWLPRRRELCHLGPAVAPGSQVDGARQHPVLQHEPSPLISHHATDSGSCAPAAMRRERRSDDVNLASDANRKGNRHEDRGLQHGSGARRQPRASPGRDTPAAAGGAVPRLRSGRGRGRGTGADVGLLPKGICRHVEKRSSRIQTRVSVPDAIPGSARRTIKRFAERIANSGRWQAEVGGRQQRH